MSIQVLFFIAFGLSIAGQLVDGITTETALNHGWKELGSASSWFISKTNASALAVFKAIVIAQILPLLTYGIVEHFSTGDGFFAGTGAALASAAVGLYDGVRNYLLLKKNKISAV